MAGNLDPKAKNDRVWIEASYDPALLKAIQRRKKQMETVPQALARFITLALAKSDRVKRSKRFS